MEEKKAMADEGWTRIATADEFNEAIVGRTITSGPDQTSVQNADGTIAGTFRGKAVSGTWSFEHGKQCREAMVGEGKLDYACNIIETRGNQIRITREDGSTQEFAIN